MSKPGLLPAKANVMKNIGYIKFALLPAAITMLLSSCHTTKHVEKSSVNVDSVWSEKYDKLNKEFSSYKESTEKEISDLVSSSVLFNEVPCPTVNIDSACSKDSMIKLINQLYDKINSQKNTLEVGADGSIKATGQIKSLKTDKQQLQKEKEQTELLNQSLSTENDSLRGELKKVASSSTKDKKVDTVGISWWFCLIFLIGGYFLRKYTGSITARVFSRFFGTPAGQKSETDL